MHAVRLPRLGQTMESGSIRHWCVAEGDAFAEGDPLYEVETEKAIAEVEAKSAGVLARILVAADAEEVEVGTTLAVVAAAGEAADPAAIAAFLASQGLSGDEQPAAAEPPAAVPPANAPAAPPPTVAAPAASPDPDPDPDPALAAGAVVAVSPPGPVLTPSGKVKAVPKARRVARDLGIDLATVTPSGERGYVRVEDVMALLAAPVPQPAAAPPTTSSATNPAPAPVAPSEPAPDAGPAVAARIPLQGVARAMADTMARTAREVPQFVQQISVDAAALVARLKRLRYEGTHVTYTDLLVGALARTAVEVPEVNASFAETEIVRYADVNVSVAMATDRGLVVPVVPHASELSIAEIARTTKDLAESARTGRISLDQLSGGTISLSNLGAFGIDTGVPIVNAPQCALVFVGKLGPEPVVVDGRIEVGTRLQLAIAYDHRVVDGMTAARFTQAFRTRIEAGG